MGRSTKSCFNIITCRSDSVDRDDLQVSESKASPDKRGWSFRKRSARDRVLSNTVISEVPSSINKESLESASFDFQNQVKTAIPEKSSEVQWTDEMPQLLASINLKFPESVAITEVDPKLDSQPDESVVIIIQTAIRRFLAERELSKQKNIIKLQAAVRGHLVRRHAVGSLRCVQAIIKMQVLVRARHTRVSAGEGQDNSTQKGERRLGTKPDLAYTSIEKILSNSFARQLLETSPRTKSMKIKCDPSKHDSAWKWLERWVSISPTGIEQEPKSETSMETKEQEIEQHHEDRVKTTDSTEEDSADFKFYATLEAVPHLNSVNEEAAVPSESEQNLATQKFEHPQSEFLDSKKSAENLHQPIDEGIPSDSSPQLELESLSSKSELEEQLKLPTETVASELSESEEEKHMFGSEKASNVAAQSNFEELKSVNVSNQENEVESCKDEVSSPITITRKIMDSNLTDYAVSSDSKVLVGSSDCGTELSISSTLDSPDQSDIGAVDERDVIITEGMDNPNNTTMCKENEATADDPSIILDTDPSVILDTELSDSIVIQTERQKNDEEPVTAESSKPEEKLEENSFDMQKTLDHETVNEMYKSSPEASPRSRVTVMESQTTPSSEVSTKSKKSRKEKNGSSLKRKSLSVGKHSPLPTNNSGVRTSLERTPKDERSGKHRNSFGSPKIDHVDQEPRESSSSLPVPSYMQATESAKAKAYANISPRSSPDVQDKELRIKKRHSLPGTNGRQGSPRIQRSTSQAKQSTKGNGNSSQDLKWQR